MEDLVKIFSRLPMGLPPFAARWLGWSLESGQYLMVCALSPLALHSGQVYARRMGHRTRPSAVFRMWREIGGGEPGAAQQQQQQSRCPSLSLPCPITQEQTGESSSKPRVALRDSVMELGLQDGLLILFLATSVDRPR
ncbi:hypothetical protein EYF80_038861 [Liparis tanakae]|uniref:Uncharacterized protein n=1 Tax=Liparis tanakae TaxID=230148 RepID=A0A4Z2GBF2_9TELE|nr:hypothetical protein EYF80_038861 [Liparis tanakae]